MYFNILFVSSFFARIRRVQQIATLYSKIWEAKAFNHVVKSLTRRSKNILLSSCLAAVYDWEKEKIPDEVLLRFDQYNSAYISVIT